MQVWQTNNQVHKIGPKKNKNLKNRKEFNITHYLSETLQLFSHDYHQGDLVIF